MHTIVLGAGITGVTTAWYLRRAGFEVSVVDRQDAAGQETSFANGGQISVSHPEPWSNPAAPLVALRWIGRAGAPLRLRPRIDHAQWQWLLAFLFECLPVRTRRNTAAIASLAAHSLDELRRLRVEAGIAEAYGARARGILHLFFGMREFERAQIRVASLARFGIALKACSATDCAEIEPALTTVAPRLAGALYAPNDESGDAMLFCRALTRVLANDGVRFHFGVGIERPGFDATRIESINIRHADGRLESLCADAYVVCLGSFSRPWLRPLGVTLPIFPLKGYSITAPLADPARAPQVSLTDESRRIVCSRLGDRLRIAGTAEVNDYNLDIDPARIESMLEWADSRLPGAIARHRAEPWTGLRPATPGGVPLIGHSVRYENLWLNTGHGPLGWTLSCGSASALAALMKGEEPGVDFPFRH